MLLYKRLLGCAIDTNIIGERSRQKEQLRDCSPLDLTHLIFFFIRGKKKKRKALRDLCHKALLKGRALRLYNSPLGRYGVDMCVSAIFFSPPLSSRRNKI